MNFSEGWGGGEEMQLLSHVLTKNKADLFCEIFARRKCVKAPRRMPTILSCIVMFCLAPNFVHDKNYLLYILLFLLSQLDFCQVEGCNCKLPGLLHTLLLLIMLVALLLVSYPCSGHIGAEYKARNIHGYVTSHGT